MFSRRLLLVVWTRLAREEVASDTVGMGPTVEGVVESGATW